MATPGQRTVKIIDMFEIPSSSPERVGRYDVIVTYQDEAMRVRTITIPKEQLEGKSDAEKLVVITNAIKAQEAEREKFIGKTITLGP